MEFNALNGTTIKNLNIDGETVSFEVDVFDRTAKIQISGVESFSGSIDIRFVPIDNEISIEKVDIDVTDITQDTFTKVVVTTTDEKVIELLGDMKAEIINEEDFQDLLLSNDCDCDDCDCDCGDECNCGCKN